MSTATKHQPMATTSALESREIVFTPFLGTEAIRLTPGMIMNFLCRPTRSGKKCSVEQAVRFGMLCKARGLNPWEGDAFLVGFDGKDGPEFNLVTAHQAFLKRAETHPEYDGMQSGVTVRNGDGVLLDVEGDLVDDDLTLVGGWCRILFKTRKTPMYKRLRLATFNKNQSRWTVDPAGMIVKCAEADALRSAFPNSLGGMYLADEFPGEQPRIKTAANRIAEALDTAALMNGNGTHDRPDEIDTIPIEAGPPPTKPQSTGRARLTDEQVAAIVAEFNRLQFSEADRTGILRRYNAGDPRQLYQTQFVALLNELQSMQSTPDREPGEEG